MRDDPETHAEVIAPSTLSHFVLKTASLAELQEWYITVLGAHVVFANAHAAFLTFDEEHHRVALVNVPGLKRAGANVTGLDHVAFTYKDLRDLIQTYKRLKKSGIQPRWCVNHRVTTSFYYQDPDGNRVELTFENYETAAELANAMNINDRKPTALFDPDDLIAHVEAGRPFEQFRDKDLGGPTHLQILQQMGLSRPEATARA